MIPANKTQWLSIKTQKLLQEKLESLSVQAQNIILEIIKENEEYQNMAIKLAMKNDKDFSKRLKEFIKKKKHQKLQEIEKEEKGEELKGFDI